MRHEVYFPFGQEEVGLSNPSPYLRPLGGSAKGGLRLPASPLMAAFLERPVRVLV